MANWFTVSGIAAHGGDHSAQYQTSILCKILRIGLICQRVYRLDITIHKQLAYTYSLTVSTRIKIKVEVSSRKLIPR